MYRTLSRFCLIVALLLSVSTCVLNSCRDSDSKEKIELSSYSPITQSLITTVESTPELKTLLEKAIAKGIEINPNTISNPVRKLKDYYDFIEYSTTAMPWSVLKWDNPKWTIFDKIDQSLNYFYFINDIPLKELDDKGLYNNSIQYMEPYRTWLIQYCKTWGNIYHRQTRGKQNILTMFSPTLVLD